MLKSGKYQIWLLDQVLASLCFCFCHPLSQYWSCTGIVSPFSQRTGLCARPCLPNAWSLGQGVEAICSTDGEAEAKRGHDSCPQGSHQLPLPLITFPKISFQSLVFLGRGAFNSEAPLVPPSSQGFSG